MNLFEDLLNGEKKLSIIGLGYVGLPIAISFAKRIKVIGFDINQQKINSYKDFIDVTNEVGDDELKKTKIEFSSNPDVLKRANFHIIAVPTPLNSDNTPDLKPIQSASRLLGKHLSKGSVVVYESTVFPGVTEDICIPILEQESGLVCGIDFKVGYSPERINPGDKIHKLENIVKIVSGIDEESLDIITKVYELVVKAGVYKAESIKVAEAAKVIENSQRDINIAFMNELSIIFNRMNIDTKQVLSAAGSKWNFLNFTPGLVGGHCIGVDPYYLTYKAEKLGYKSKIILAGRKINDDMGRYVAENVIKEVLKGNFNLKNLKVGIFGFTFKENVPDTRNTRVIDIINELISYQIKPKIYDPIANNNEVKNEYGFTLSNIEEMKNLDVIIFAVSHNAFHEYDMKMIMNFYNQNGAKIIFDLKGLYQKEGFIKRGYSYWSL